jgi:hypothetical protein
MFYSTGLSGFFEISLNRHLFLWISMAVYKALLKESGEAVPCPAISKAVP